MKTPIIKSLALLVLAVIPGFAQGTITTVAGSSSCCSSADGQAATSIWLPAASGITLDSLGNLYIWDGASSKVRKVNTSGIIGTVAGNGTPGYAGDGGPATSAQIFASSGPMSGLAVDASGDLFISDSENHVIRKVSAAGVITTYAGNGSGGFSGDGGLATAAQLFYPAGIALDSAGNLYIADSSNNRVRKVTPTGVITTVAGNGNVSYSGDGVQATTTAVHDPTGVTVDSQGNLYISETTEARVRKVDPSGIISTVAGQTTKTRGFSGDGGQATAATLNAPIGLAVDRSGNLYIADSGNSRIRKVDAAGIITTYAGIGKAAADTPIGDGGPATSAFLGEVKDVALDAAGNLYIAASTNGPWRVRKVTPGTSLSVSPGSLSFTYTMGGAAPASQSVSVASSGGDTSFTASASTVSGGDWLSVGSTTGAIPGPLAVSVNPTGLPGGVYQGGITITPTGSETGPLTFAVTLTVAGASAPNFSSDAVVNALGYQNKLAPDTVFVIFGSGLGPASLVAASAPNYPTTLAGTSVTFTPAAGGVAVAARMVYTLAGQIAALLPSSITPGTYAVRVTFNTLTSAPQNVTVVERSLGIASSNSAGTGTAQATIGNVNNGISLTRFTTGRVAFGGLTWTLSPAHPGDTLVLWGTGGGADPANDTGGSSGDQTQAGNFSVLVNGRAITPLYAGASSGYPGLWQVNFTLPADIAPGCFTSVQVSAGGELSNLVTIPIAAAGQSFCADPQLSQSDLAALDGGGTVAGGGFGIAKFTNSSAGATQESAGGAIGLYTAAEYAALYSGIKVDACIINDRTASATAKNPAAPDRYLDAGATIPVGGPGLPAGAAMGIVNNNPGPIYDLAMPNGTLTGGNYTITGNGGKDVGPFNVTVNFPASFSVNGWDALNSIDRSAPLTISWTGGEDQVDIILSTYTVVGKDASATNILHNVGITCQVPAASGSYTIPSSVLSYLIPGSGIITVEAANEKRFNASLTGSGQLSFGGVSGTLGVGRTVTVK